jgi:hypothetical protein
MPSCQHASMQGVFDLTGIVKFDRSVQEDFSIVPELFSFVLIVAFHDKGRMAFGEGVTV